MKKYLGKFSKAKTIIVVFNSSIFDLTFYSDTLFNVFIVWLVDVGRIYFYLCKTHLWSEIRNKVMSLETF